MESHFYPLSFKDLTPPTLRTQRFEETWPSEITHFLGPCMYVSAAVTPPPHGSSHGWFFWTQLKRHLREPCSARYFSHCPV